MTRARWKQAATALLFAAASATCLPASPVEAAPPSVVYFAGFGYAGDFDSINSRFHYTTQLVPAHRTGDGTGPSEAENKLLEGVRLLKPANLTLMAGSLAPGDRAILLVMVQTGETVSTELIGNLYKLYINLRAEALFFDYKSMTILRAYPLSAVYLDALPQKPTDAGIRTAVQRLLYTDKDSLVARFLQRVERAEPPGLPARCFGVSDVKISPEAAAWIPAYLRGNNVAETWIADKLTEYLSDRTRAYVLPFAKGYVTGNVMPARMADGTAYNLTVPTPAYPITLEPQALKKLPYDVKTGLGSSYIYASIIHLLIEEPRLPKRYLDARLLNGEAKVVPGNEPPADWPAFEASTFELFRKLSLAIHGSEGLSGPERREIEKWINDQDNPRELRRQLQATREVIEQCK